MADPRHERGARAERAVASWLGERGWTVLAQRWRTAAGELDLVCIDPAQALVGIEVKLRSTGRSGRALEAIDGRRLVRLRHALASYAATSGRPPRQLRIDLVCVEPAQGGWRLQHLPGIDGW